MSRLHARRITETIVLAALAAGASGCDRDSSDNDERSAESRPLLAAFNAVPDMRAITFLREEEEWSALQFGEATTFRSVDADQYDLNFDTILPGDETTECTGQDGDGVKDDDECTRLASQSINVIPDHEYVVALLGRWGNLRVQVYDKLVHHFDTSTDDGDPDDETAEVQFFHWSDELPAIDVYLARPGAILSPVDALATLTSGEEFHAVVDDGDYVITLSPVADPADPLFTSQTFTLRKHTRVAFAILPGAGDGTSAIKIARFRDQSGTLLDRRVKTELRFANVAPDSGSFDVYIEGDFTRPFVAGLAEGTMSDYVVVPPDAVTDLDIEITPAGNPAVLLGREQVDLARGERATFVIFGSVGRLDGMRVPDPFRRISTHARVRLINAASGRLDFFVVPTGSNISTLSPTAQLAAAATTSLIDFDPERYDIVLTRAATDEVVFGPETVELVGGGIYTVIATDTGSLMSVDALLLDDFAN